MFRSAAQITGQRLLSSKIYMNPESKIIAAQQKNRYYLIMKKLLQLILENEEWLMQRILDYSLRQDYVKYTSTLREAWRKSIQGLSEAVCTAIESGRSLELTPDEDFTEDPVAAFGIIEAKMHRERGIPYAMFIGLFKYYRDTYMDLIKEQGYPDNERDKYIGFLERGFDRIEIGFSSEWIDLKGEEQLDELRNSNRIMTNEKNMFLTVVESLASPVFFLNTAGETIYINRAASRILKLSHVPGSYYYNRENIKVTLPQWLKKHFEIFVSESPGVRCFEETDPDDETIKTYQGRIARMEDVSGKFSGTVIVLTDITDRIEAENRVKAQKDDLEKALADIKKLRGILPICANCKKIRNDSGYWDQVEKYISEHSDVEFSHGLCPECIDKLYPELKKKR